MPRSASIEAPSPLTPIVDGAGSPLPRDPVPWFYPLIGFGMVALLCLVYLGQYAALVHTQYQIVGLRAKQRQLAREQAEMELQVQQLTSLERVEHIASVRLGMTPPEGRQVLELHPAFGRKPSVKGPTAEISGLVARH